MTLQLVTLLLLGAFSACKSVPKLEPGDELFGILDEVVLGVSLQSPTKLAKAQRVTTDKHFEYTFESAIGAMQTHCAARPELDRAVASTYEIRVRGLLEAGEAREFLATHKIGWSKLEVRSVIVDAELFTLYLLRNPKRPEYAYAMDPDDSRLFFVDSKLLHLLDLDCGLK